MVKRLVGQHASCFDVNLQQIHVDDPSLTGRSLGCLARTEFRHKAVERLEEINLMTFVPLTINKKARNRKHTSRVSFPYDLRMSSLCCMILFSRSLPMPSNAKQHVGDT
jgi:hypothetical protein